MHWQLFAKFFISTHARFLSGTLKSWNVVIEEMEAAWPLPSRLWFAFVWFRTSENVFRINRYFQKGTPQLVTWNSPAACRSNSLESIKTPKGTPCSPPNLLVLLLSRQSLPIPPSPPFLSFVLISSKACDFYPSALLFMQQSLFHQPRHARETSRKLYCRLHSAYVIPINNNRPLCVRSHAAEQIPTCCWNELVKMMHERKASFFGGTVNKKNLKTVIWDVGKLQPSYNLFFFISEMAATVSSQAKCIFGLKFAFTHVKINRSDILPPKKPSAVFFHVWINKTQFNLDWTTRVWTPSITKCNPFLRGIMTNVKLTFGCLKMHVTPSCTMQRKM